MELYGVAISCVKAVTALCGPEFFPPNLEGYGRRRHGLAPEPNPVTIATLPFGRALSLYLVN